MLDSRIEQLPDDVLHTLRLLQADVLGLTGAHVNRTLNRLRAEGIALVGNDHLSIRDVSRLAALAGTAVEP